MDRILCFSDTLGPNTINKNHLIKFEIPLSIEEIQIIKNGNICHPTIEHLGQTIPSSFDLKIYAKTNEPSLSSYKELGIICFQNDEMLKSSINDINKYVVDSLIVTGTFDYVTLNIYSKELSSEDEIKLKELESTWIEDNDDEQDENTDINTNNVVKNHIVSFKAETDEFGDVASDMDSLNLIDIDFDKLSCNELGEIEKTWLKFATCFNPHQALLSDLEQIRDISLNMFENELINLKNQNNIKKDKNEIVLKLEESVNILSSHFHQNRWIFVLEDLQSTLSSDLCFILTYRSDKLNDILNVLSQSILWCISKDTWFCLPSVLNIRFVRTSLQVINLLFSLGNHIVSKIPTNLFIESFSAVLNYFEMSSSIIYLIEKAYFYLACCSEGIKYVYSSSITPDTQLSTYSNLFIDKNSVGLFADISTILEVYSALSNIDAITKKYAEQLSNIDVNENELTISIEVESLTTSLSVISRYLYICVMENSDEFITDEELVLRSRYITIMPVIFHHMKKMNFIESITLLITSLPYFKKNYFSSELKRILIFLCANNSCRFFLSLYPTAMNLITSLLLNASETSIQSYILPMNAIINNPQSIPDCTWVDIGFNLILSLQTVQSYDHLLSYQKVKNISQEDSSDIIATFHQILCMMSSEHGQYAVISFFCQANTIENLLPFLEDINNIKERKQYDLTTLLQKYTYYIFTKIIQKANNLDYIIKNTPRLIEWMKKENEPHLCECLAWLMPIKRIKTYDIETINILTQYILEALEEYNINIHSVRGCSTAIRLIWYLVCNLSTIPSPLIETCCLISRPLYFVRKLFQFNIVEMMNKFLVKIKLNLCFQGSLRLNYSYLYSIYLSILPLINLNNLIFKTSLSLNTFPFNQKYIDEFVSVYCYSDQFKIYLPLESINEIQQMIFEFFYEILLINKNDDLIPNFSPHILFNSIFSFIKENPENVQSGLILFYQLLTMMIKDNDDSNKFIEWEEVIMLNEADIVYLIDTYSISNSLNVFTNLCFVLTELTLIGHKLATLIIDALISMFNGESSSSSSSSENNIEHGSENIYINSFLILTSILTNIPTISIIFYNLYFKDNFNNITNTISFIGKLFSNKHNHNESKIYTCVYTFIFSLIQIGLLHTDQNHADLLDNDYYINMMLTIVFKSMITKNLGALNSFNIIIQNILFNKIFIRFLSNKKEEETLKFVCDNFSFLQETNISILIYLIHIIDEYFRSPQIFLKQFYPNIQFNDIKLNEIYHNIILPININEFEFENQSNVSFLNYEHLTTYFSNVIKCIFTLQIPHESIPINVNNIFTDATDFSKFLRALEALLKIKTPYNGIIRHEQRRKFDPLLNMKRLNTENTTDHASNVNLKDKIRISSEVYKSRRALTSRLPSLHVDDFVALHTKKPNTVTKPTFQPFFTSLLNNQNMFPLLPKLNPNMAVNAAAVFQRILCNTTQTNQKTT